MYHNLKYIDNGLKKKKIVYYLTIFSICAPQQQHNQMKYNNYIMIVKH